MFLINLAPSLLARKAYLGREKVAHAFKRFFDRDPTGRSSALAEARYEAAHKYGITTTNMGRLEVGTLIGILVNTVPTLFYLLYHIFSDRSLLHSLRAEFQSSTPRGTQEKDSEQREINLDTTTLRENCPLLSSTYQEVLRLYSRGATARLVTQDTILNNQYLLTKGSVLMMPASVLHFSPAIWGQTDFQARRFLKHDAAAGGPKKGSAAAYRPFGGGSSLCPGRHFASAEILALAAVILFQYDIEPAAGKWTPPVPCQKNLAVNVFTPRSDVLVSISPRPGFEDIKWTFN